MSHWSDAGHIEPTGDLFPALQPDEHGNLPSVGQRFIQLIVRLALETAQQTESHEEVNPAA